MPPPARARLATLHTHNPPHPGAGRDAAVLDFVQFNRRAALNGALKHSACSYAPPTDGVPGSD